MNDHPRNLVTVPWWQLKIRYEWLGGAINNCFGHYSAYLWYKSQILPDEWIEIRRDIFSMYCAGGEL